MEKCGNLWKNGRFSGRIWPDWGNTARADMAGLGSIGLMSINFYGNEDSDVSFYLLSESVYVRWGHGSVEK